MDKPGYNTQASGGKEPFPPPYPQDGGAPQMSQQQGPPIPQQANPHPRCEHSYPPSQLPNQQGYPVQINTGYTTHPAQPPQVGQRVTFINENSEGGLSSLQKTIPAMPMCVAVFLFVINCLLPGFGTMFAGLTVCCCADTRHSGMSKVAILCANFGMGFAQLILIGIFLIGWIWSIVWGVFFISVSGQFYGKSDQAYLVQQPQVVTRENAQVVSAYR